MQRLNGAAVTLFLAAAFFLTPGCAPATPVPTPSPSQAMVDLSATPTRQATPTTTAVPTRVVPRITPAPGLDTTPTATPAASPATPTATPATPAAPVAPAASPTAPSQAEKLLEEAKKDAASRAGVDVSEVAVVKAETVDWRDSSLGCPEPGMVYLQVITPGYRFVLKANGNSYEYHTDRGSRVILCQNPEPSALPN